MKKQLISAILCLFIIGCASTETYVETISTNSSMDLSHLLKDKTKGRIYVLRDSKFVGSAIGIQIHDNGRTVGKLGNGGIVTWERPPGLCNLGASASNEQNASVEVEAGNVYFFEARVTWGAGFNSGQAEMRQLTDIEGYSRINEN